MLEDSTMVSLAYRRDQTLFLLEGWSSDAFHGALRGLAGASITMDWMAGAGALMVSLASHEGERALAVFRRHCPTDGAVECREGYAHLSMIGTASEAQPWMVEQCLEYIEVSGIPLAGWTASDVRLTLVLPEAYLTQALQGLHNRLLGASESGDRHASN
jgi:aspartokinase